MSETQEDKESPFVRAFIRGTESLRYFSTGICSKCPECQAASGLPPRQFFSAYEAGRIDEEGAFSWSDCDICGSGLGGDRYSGHYCDDDGKVQHLSDICCDCVVFAANGDEPEDWGS